MSKYASKETGFNVLEGLTLDSIEGADKGSEEIIFKTTCGRTFYMFHYQDCCEFVRIEDIEGDVKDVVGLPIVQAREDTKDGEGDYDSGDRCTWTFYTIRTHKGTLWVRWKGESNGYYSEAVDFRESRNDGGCMLSD